MPQTSNATAQPLDNARRGGLRAWLAPVVLAAAFFAAVAPTLSWQQFAGGSENLVVETVLEMRRGGPWFIPTLQGMPRLSKPPLAAWITAAAARPATIEWLSAREPAEREAAFRSLAWEVRWPTLVSACAMLLATYALGDLLLGSPVGLVAALACGSSLLFLRFCRSATTDVQLALWVTSANALLALALLRRHYWAGFLGAGLALGLSLMSKGPVGLVQSVLPFALFLGWRRHVDPERHSDMLTPLLAGVALMLVVALPWPMAVLLRYPDVWHAWLREITREGATQLAPDPWYYYFVFPFWISPWLAFLVVGLWTASRSVARVPAALSASEDTQRRRQGYVLALMLTIIPIVVMSFAKDKVERYVLPMAAPAAVLAAAALVDWYRSGRRDPRGRIVEAVHWGTLVVFSVAPAVIARWPHCFGLEEGRFDLRLGVSFGAAALLLLVLNLLRSLRTPLEAQTLDGPVRSAALTAVVVLMLQYPAMRGYSQVATSDLKPLADVVWAQYPDAVLYEYEPGTRTRTYLDLPIYAGRLSRKVNDPAALAPADRPQVVVFFHRQGEPPALAEPWKQLASGGGRKDRWRAYVLPAAR